MNLKNLTNKVDTQALLKIGVVACCIFILFRITKRAKQNIDIYTTSTVGATITPLQATAIAQKIASAWGFFNDDENGIYQAFEAINNYQDLILVMRAYNYKGQTLATSITRYMNTKEINRINEILFRKGINFKF